MIFATTSFAQAYHKLIIELQNNPTKISCRGMEIIYELTDVTLQFPVKNVSIYSHINSRCVPIRFILAEWLWILSGSDRVFDIGRFNSKMMKYSDDGVTLNGAYGKRLDGQFDAVLDKLVLDKYTRQAYLPIYIANDNLIKSKDIPCNTSLQFLIRDNQMNLTVVQRSSDFVTGLSIDAIHWQILLLIVTETLRKYYRYLMPGRITYHITSLHVYSVDDGVINTWKTEFLNAYDHTVGIRDDFTSLRRKAKEKFSECETLMELLDLYEFSAYEKDLLIMLNRQFIAQTNKPVR